MTYSIIGRDAAAGEIGIAVQSRWFNVGQDVAWIEPGVGALCTRAIVEPAYGQRGLELLRSGSTPEQALATPALEDPGREIRQVAIADLDGRFAQHTGEACVAAAGHIARPTAAHIGTCSRASAAGTRRSTRSTAEPARPQTACSRRSTPRARGWRRARTTGRAPARPPSREHRNSLA